MALANSNSGASGVAAPGAVVLVSNLNEKVMMGGYHIAAFSLSSVLLKSTISFFLTPLAYSPLLHSASLPSLVCALDLLPVLLTPQDDHSSCSIRSLWYVSSFSLFLPLGTLYSHVYAHVSLHTCACLLACSSYHYTFKRTYSPALVH